MCETERIQFDSQFLYLQGCVLEKKFFLNLKWDKHMDFFFVDFQSTTVLKKICETAPVSEHTLVLFCSFPSKLTQYFCSQYWKRVIWILSLTLYITLLKLNNKIWFVFEKPLLYSLAAFSTEAFCDRHETAAQGTELLFFNLVVYSLWKIKS